MRKHKAVGRGSALARLQPPPLTISDAATARDVVLRLAGIDVEEQASIVRETVSQLRSALQAMSTVDPTYIDWYARIKASEKLLMLVGAFPSRTASPHGAPQVSINIELPDWAQPMMRRTVTPPGGSDTQSEKT
jgi:hypothetical protein